MFQQAARTLFRYQLRQEWNILRKTTHDGIANKTNGKSTNELFFNKKIQELLRKISTADPAKVLQLRKIGKLDDPIFEFMTNEELEIAKKESVKKATHYLQIPPVVDPKAEDVEILSVDPCIDGHDLEHSKMVFTDISFNLKEQERIIVVREPNGVLRTANKIERHRMCEAYFPRPGRHMEPPRLFEEENLKSLWDRKEYKFLLDSACAQFEPDDSKYQEIVFKTYEKVNEMRDFNYLHATRHIGALAFYLVLNDKMDNMILDYISSLRIDDAVSLVQLYHLIHLDCKSSKISTGDDEIGVLKAYIENDSKNPGELSLALKAYLDLQSSKKNVSEGIQEAHGV